jgi:putative intracellular protease/amidase
MTVMKPEQRSLRAQGAIILLATLLFPSVARAAEPLPVLLVIANRDFWYQEYADVRKELAAQRLKVVVAAGSTAAAVPQERDVRRVVTPDVALGEVDAADYSAVVFVGGWGASSYQYAFSGTYASLAYQPDPVVAEAVNDLINDFIEQDKYVSAISHGVTVLAWARVNDASPLQGRTVAAWPGGSPAFEYDGQSYEKATMPVYWHVILNGGSVLTAGSMGGPLTSADDVVVDGQIITGENYDSAALFARTLARAIAGR